MDSHRRYRFYLLLGIAAWGLSATVLSPPVNATQQVGIPIIVSPSGPVSIETDLVITFQITTGPGDTAPILPGINLLLLDANNAVVSMLTGVGRDNGTNGDAVAGDGVFTFHAAAQQTAPGQMRMRVSVPFYGIVRRALSPITSVTLQ